MIYFKRSGGQIALFVLALIAIAISIYLTIVHYDTQVVLVCSSTGFVNCEHVLSSSYSVVPGTSFPVSIPGILWGLVAAGLAFASWRIWPQRRSLLIAEALWAGIGLLPVFYLIYVELVRLHTLCAWCTGVHVLVLLYLLIAVVLVQEPAYADEGKVFPRVAPRRR